MKCNIHTVELGKKTYFVFVGVKNYRVFHVFVWRKKPDFFYLPENIDNLKAKMMFIDGRIDLTYKDHRGYKVTFEGLNRLQDDKPHESLFNKLLPDLDLALSHAKSCDLNKLRDWRKAILQIFDK